MYKPPRFIVLAALLLLGSACSKRLATQPPPDTLETLTAPAAEELCKRGPGGAATILGTTRRGALYALYRPENWNGDLVLYAHGFIAPAAPIALPTADNTVGLRDGLLARGFAVAYSSFSSNGYAVEEGIPETEALAHRFKLRLGHPRRVFLAGQSLGGLIILALAEQHPNRYAGVLDVSGVLGGGRREFDYVANVRVLFDYFYPDTLPGDLLHLPAGIDLQNDIIGPAVAAMTANPSGALAMSQLLPIPFRDGQELLGSIVQALVLHTLELGDLLERTRGGSFFDNSKTVYSGALPAPLLADLNARVERYSVAPFAAAYMNRLYEPTGRLEIPMITLHMTLDPTVPYFHETVYRDLVQAHGDPGLLVQRGVEGYGHTIFTADQMLAAFEDLVKMAVQSKHEHDQRAVVATLD